MITRLKVHYVRIGNSFSKQISLLVAMDKVAMD